MVVGRISFHMVDKQGEYPAITIAVRDIDGAMVGNIVIHARQSAYSDLLSQFELRSEDIKGAVGPLYFEVDYERHSHGLTGELVQMESREPHTDSVRLSLYLQCVFGRRGKRFRHGKTKAAAP